MTIIARLKNAHTRGPFLCLILGKNMVSDELR